MLYFLKLYSVIAVFHFPSQTVLFIVFDLMAIGFSMMPLFGLISPYVKARYFFLFYVPEKIFGIFEKF